MSLPDRSDGERSVPTSPIPPAESEDDGWRTAFNRLWWDLCRMRGYLLSDPNPFPRISLFHSPRRSTR